MRIAHYHNVLVSTREFVGLVLLVILCMFVAASASWVMGWYMGKADEALECPEKSVSIAVWPDHLDCTLVVVADPAPVKQRQSIYRKRSSK